MPALADLRDLCAGQAVHVVGRSKTLERFDGSFFADKFCVALDGAYKRRSDIGPMLVLSDLRHAHCDDDQYRPLADEFRALGGPIVTVAAARPLEGCADCRLFADPEEIWTITRATDRLLAMPCDPAFGVALQLAWILGATAVFTAGCEIGAGDLEAFGAIRCFLERKGVALLDLSPAVGYHLVDYQLDVLSGLIGVDDVLKRGPAP